MLTVADGWFLRKAYEQAKIGLDEGNYPIGAALASGNDVIASGRNRSIKTGDLTAHGELDCLRQAGNFSSRSNLTLYTTMSPCIMCSGALIHLGIKRVVIGEIKTYAGFPEFLSDNGVEVVIADDPNCVEIIRNFIDDNPDLWFEVNN